MKKIMNGADRFVDESLAGIVLAHPEMLKFAPDSGRAVVCADAPIKGQVGIVTGGGYGHLPTFLGYVGRRLCSGVAVGNVFTSPSWDAIRAAADAVNGGSGILFLFGNYTGDTMNFEMAAEMLEAEDIPCRIIKASDDAASAPRDSWRDRRGVAGIFFAYKVAGAAAANGLDLAGVCAVTERVCERTATMGVSVSSCHLPGSDTPIFEIGPDEMELGMGIHGEPGVQRCTLMSADALSGVLVERLVADLELKSGDETAVLVNGLGGTSLEELYILYGEIRKRLNALGIRAVRTYVGEYATSMEMQGASLSLLKVDSELLELLDASAASPFFRQ